MHEGYLVASLLSIVIPLRVKDVVGNRGNRKSRKQLLQV